MKLEIKPTVFDGFNCIENDIFSIYKWKLHEYELGFIGSWAFSFDYNKPTDLLGNKIYAVTQEEITDNFAKYYGANIKEYRTKTIQDSLDIISSEVLKKLPVVIYIDIYNCPWFKEYHISHGGHYCTVVGIDKNSNLECIDSMPTMDNVIIDLKDYSEGYGNILTFQFTKNRIKKLNLKSTLNDCTRKLGLHTESKDSFCDMRYFADCLENIPDISYESQGFDTVWSIPLCKSMGRIYGVRLQTKKLFEYLLKVYHENILSNLIEQFQIICYRWAMIKSLIYKAILANKNDIMKNIANKVREVSVIEEDAANMIYNYTIDKPIFISANYDQFKKYKMDYIFVDLNKYFNNKGFGGENASFGREGEYFLVDDLPDTKIWTVQNMKFNFPDVFDTNYDNISCKNQVIKLPSGDYHYIMLLCCAEWGDFVENITANYKDGTKELLGIAVSDWAVPKYTEEPLFPEPIAWRGNYIYKPTGEKMIGSIYAISYHMNKHSQMIESIILPDCDNIHIFSITLVV